MDGLIRKEEREIFYSVMVVSGTMAILRGYLLKMVVGPLGEKNSDMHKMVSHLFRG